MKFHSPGDYCNASSRDVFHPMRHPYSLCTDECLSGIIQFAFESFASDYHVQASREEFVPSQMKIGIDLRHVQIKAKKRINKVTGSMSPDVFRSSSNHFRLALVKALIF